MPNNTPIACKSIEASLAASVGRLEALEKRLANAPTQNKSNLLRMIDQMETKIDVLQNSLDTCIASSPSPPDLWLRSMNLEVDLVAAILNIFLRNLSLRLHNTGSGDHRHSTIDLQQKNAQGIFVSLSGFPSDLGQLSSTVDYHFNDINSTSIRVDSDSISTSPLKLEVLFETNDEEIIANNWFNKNFELFTVTIMLDLGVDGESGLLMLRPIKVETKVVVGHWFGDSEDSDIENAFNTKIKEQLTSSAKTIGAALTNGLIATNRASFDYKVKSVIRQSTAWVVSYDQIPKLIVFQP
jgi:hypothetical protein